MNPWDEFIVITMPFLFSSLTIFFGKAVETYALNLFKLNKPQGITDAVRNLSIELATQVYIQLGFIFSVLSACVSCIAFTVKSPRPLFAAVGGFLLVILIPTWLLFWQSLPLKQLKGREGKWMRWSKWSVIIISYIVTLIARYYPVAQT